MTDKKTVGSFIRSKRTEKRYSQKELAEMLYITEWAVSKWERGISYPDITLIPELCRVLEISEHELITAATDTDTRSMRRDARKFRMIRSVWFWVPTISYSVTILTCFICNLAVQHTLSWFFIVLAALVCAYTFVPTMSPFFESGKLLVFSLSTYLSICLLLFTCAVYTGDLSWFLTACIGILIGYELLFVPVLLRKSRLGRWRFVIAFLAGLVLTVLLLLNIRVWHSFPLQPAILTACYGFAPMILCAVISLLPLDGFLKTGICIVSSTAAYACLGWVVSGLFGLEQYDVRVDFRHWSTHLQGNVLLITVTSFLLLGAVFAVIGICRKSRRCGG